MGEGTECNVLPSRRGLKTKMHMVTSHKPYNIILSYILIAYARHFLWNSSQNCMFLVSGEF